MKVSKILHLDKLLNTEKSIKSCKIRLKKYDSLTSLVGKCIRSSYRERELAYEEVFGVEFRQPDFETIKISGHADPGAYLSDKIYGDYK